MYGKSAVKSEIRVRQEKEIELLAAVKNGHFKEVKQLLSNLMLVTQATSLKALEAAIASNHLAIVKELLQVKCVVDAISCKEGSRILLKAMECDHLELAKELLKVEAIKKELAQEFHWRKIIRVAIKYGWLETIKELVMAGSPYRAYEIILEEIIGRGRLMLAKELLQIEAIKKELVHGFRWREIIRAAIKYDWSEIVKGLAAASSSYRAYEILEEVIGCGHLKLAKELLKIEAIKKELAQEFLCREIIEAAIRSNRIEVVRGILQIDVMRKLVAADYWLNQEIIRLQGLESAIKLGYSEGVIAFLQEKGPRIRVQGSYFLRIAIESEQAEALEALLSSANSIMNCNRYFIVN